jgi:hypothetical protein
LTEKKPPPNGRKDSGRRDLYPWDEWFRTAQSRTVLLVRGKHFQSQTHGFVQTLRNAAIRAGVRVSVVVEEDAVAIEAKPKQKGKS